jgi:hypothetical protein
MPLVQTQNDDHDYNYIENYNVATIFDIIIDENGTIISSFSLKLQEL